MRAYDLEILTQPADRAATDNHGWCFGLPPGITSQQWPLDLNTGYPLMHGFTLLLPVDCRVHGPEIVALSFFATAADQSDGSGSGRRVPGVRAAFDLTADPPSDRRFLPFWQASRTAHGRMYRMNDILGCEYAAILLTQAEFDGSLCQPPMPAQAALDGSKAPQWFEIGTGAAWFKSVRSTSIDDYRAYMTIDTTSDHTRGFHRAIRWTPREFDPNAGIEPRDTLLSPGSTYQEFAETEKDEASGEYRFRDWAIGHKPDHIGGTMRPCQAVPEFSPYYIEFGEGFGGYNFGGGNAQLDFRDMKFDWAC